MLQLLRQIEVVPANGKSDSTTLHQQTARITQVKGFNENDVG